MFKLGWLCSLCWILSACTVDTQNQKDLAEIDANLALMDLQHQEEMAGKAKLLEALQLAPQDASVLAAWGYYLASVGDMNDAREAYEHALNLAPLDPQIEDDYAVFLYQQKDYQGALSYFLQAAHNEHYLYSGLAYQNASFAAAHLGDVAAAKEYQEKAELMMPELAGH